MNAIRYTVTDVTDAARAAIGYGFAFLWALLLPKAVLAARLLAAESQLAACRRRIEQRQQPRPRFSAGFRFLWILLSKLLPGWERCVQLMQPATVKRWHTSAFRLFWRWRSRRRNHLNVSWAMDFFTVTTLPFATMYVFVVLDHGRRRVVHLATTYTPSMSWVVQQLREAMPFGEQPRYMFPDNDGIYGHGVRAFLDSCGIEEVRTAYRSPWQSPYVERFIGTLRRELLDHVIIVRQAHLERLLAGFINDYYHIGRPHRGLDGGTPFPQARTVAITGTTKLLSIPVLGGLHHRYFRVAA